MKIQRFTFNPFQENTYVLSGESGSCVIIDPGCYDRSEQQQLTNYIKENNLKVKAVWNTHCHIDHVLGNAFCCDTYNVELWAHKEELFTLSYVERSAMMYGIDGYISSPEPTQWFEDNQEVVVDDIRVKVIFGPGHSIGHVAFYNEAEHLLIGGDILFRGGFGRYDLPGGDLDTLVKTITERLFILPENTVVFSGHGPETTIGAEKRSNPILDYNH
jgi:hydroxyacylglutathione hydrolase